MARNKKLLVASVRDSLAQAAHILDQHTDNLTYQEILAAATSANQAAAKLYQVAGMLDVEATSPAG